MMLKGLSRTKSREINVFILANFGQLVKLQFGRRIIKSTRFANTGEDQEILTRIPVHFQDLLKKEKFLRVGVLIMDR